MSYCNGFYLRLLLPTRRSRVRTPLPAPRFILMSDLSKKKCVACDGNIPPFDTSEIHKYLKKVDGWNVKSNEDKSFYLIKDFKFKNFEESQKFVNEVGNIAEEENHHPDITFGWGYCKVKIFTHAIKGLAESDFILAAKIDKIN